jgi:hypothetical protein
MSLDLFGSEKLGYSGSPVEITKGATKFMCLWKAGVVFQLFLEMSYQRSSWLR